MDLSLIGRQVSIFSLLFFYSNDSIDISSSIRYWYQAWWFFLSLSLVINDQSDTWNQAETRLNELHQMWNGREEDEQGRIRDIIPQNGHYLIADNYFVRVPLRLTILCYR